MSKRGRKSRLVSELDSIVKRSANNVTKSYADCEDRGQDKDNEKACSPPRKRGRTEENRYEQMNCSTLEELATSLTMPTFLVLYQACKFVPFSFLKGREAIIANIMRASNIDLSETELSCAIKAIDCQEESLAAGAPPTDILWRATNSTGMPHLRFLGPPSVFCYRCHSPLSANNSPTSIVLYSQDGPIPASKIILRCKSCNVHYHPEVFGNGVDGYRYYDEIQPVVKCTQQAYIERQLCSMVASAGYVLMLISIGKSS